MAGLLQKFKSKVEELKNEFAGAPAESNYEKQIAEHVDRATSSMLTGPDWGCNFELIDIINNDPQGACDKVFRAIRRCLLKPDVHTQLLALTLLEACVKNCVPFFFQQLIYSDVWHDILRAGEPTRNWDPEVRDKALGLVEDFARGLPLPAYKDAYEGLLDRGVDFPVRPNALEAGGVPYYTPPPMPAAAMAAAQGISPEDRAAIAAAVADLEAQAAEQASREAALAPPGLPSAGHVPALMGPAVLMGAPIRPPGYHPPPGYHAPHPAAMQPAMVAGAQPILPPAAGGHATPAADAVGVPQAGPDVEQSIKVGKNSADLLQEMLGPLSAPGADRTALQEPFVADLVQNCYRCRAVLADLIPRLTEEQLISSALAANDDLSKALREYEALLQGQPSAAGVAAAGLAVGHQGDGAGAGSLGGASSSVAPAAASGTAGTFTLGDDDEDEEEMSLQSRRGQVASKPAGDLIDLDSSAQHSSTGGAASNAEQHLVNQMDQLLLSGTTSGAGNTSVAGSTEK